MELTEEKKLTFYLARRRRVWLIFHGALILFIAAVCLYLHSVPNPFWSAVSGLIIVHAGLLWIGSEFQRVEFDGHAFTWFDRWNRGRGNIRADELTPQSFWSERDDFGRVTYHLAVQDHGFEFSPAAQKPGLLISIILNSIYGYPETKTGAPAEMPCGTFRGKIPWLQITSFLPMAVLLIFDYLIDRKVRSPSGFHDFVLIEALVFIALAASRVASSMLRRIEVTDGRLNAYDGLGRRTADFLLSSAPTLTMSWELAADKAFYSVDGDGVRIRWDSTFNDWNKLSAAFRALADEPYLPLPEATPPEYRSWNLHPMVVAPR